MLGEPDTGNNRQLALRFIHQVKELLIDLKFPRRFENETVKTTPAVVKEVMEHGGTFLRSNMKPVAADDVAEVFNNAVKGWNL